MPEIQQLVSIRADGGGAAAAELDKVNRALKGVRAGHDDLRRGFGQTIQASGIRVAANAVGDVVKELTGLRGIGRAAEGAFHGLTAAIGPVGLVLTAVSGAIVIWNAVVSKNREEAAKAAAEMKKQGDQARETAVELEKAARAGVILTAAEQELLRTNRALKAVEITPEIKAAGEAYDKAQGAVRKFKNEHADLAVKLNSVRSEIPGANTEVDRYKINLANLERSASSAKIALDRLTGSVKPMADRTKDATDAAKKNEDAIEDQRKAYERLGKAIEKSGADAQQAWEQDMRAATAATEAMMMGGLAAVHAGAITFGNFFKGMADVAIRELERIVVKGFVANLLGGLFGGAPLGGLIPSLGSEVGGPFSLLGGSTAPNSLPSFQFGGRVPGSTGSPQVIMAHGGEHVVSTSGTGAPPGGGDGGTTFAPVFQGMNGQSRHRLLRGLRRLVRTVGEPGLA